MKRDPDTRKAFTVALALHGLVLVALVLSAVWSRLFAEPLPDHVFQLTEPVVDAPLQPALAAQPAAAPPVKPLDSPKLPDLKPADIKLPPPPKPQESPPPPKPTPQPKPDAPKPQTIDYSRFLKENSLPKQAAAPPAKPAAPVPAVKIDASAITRDLQQNLSREDNARISQMSSAQQSDLYDYFQQIKALLDGNFARPDGVHQSLKATVEFRVERDGRISSTRIARSSGDSVLDQAALDAFRRVGRFPAPPGGAAYTRTVDFLMRTQ